jgi:signal transduction histidine kinase
MPTKTAIDSWAIAKRQLAVISVFLLLFAMILAVLYWKDRQREWRLREEQATHRLDLAFELISRDLERVRSDILYVANQPVVQSFQADDTDSKKRVETEFVNFLRFKQTYQQLRLINAQGLESVRVDLRGSQVYVVPDEQLQDKKNRYYVQESLELQSGEILVSEFDLNQEYGVIEQPLNPVIRFVTPVGAGEGETQYLLVANYRGAPLLSELSRISLPGETYLIRDDGGYLLGPGDNNSWGWLLGHDRTFASQFSQAWVQSHDADHNCLLTPSGAFAFREVQLQNLGHVPQEANRAGKSKVIVSHLVPPAISRAGRSIQIVSHLPAEQVFATSNQLLNRLLVLVALILLPLYVLTRFWAVASLRRKQQNRLILESERKLRELSSRLVKIQEDERRAISREIHDQLGQQATAINLDLKLAERKSESSEVKQQLQRAIDESEQLLNTLHDFAARVRPVELDDLGLYDAVESHLWEFKQRSGIEFGFQSNINQVELPAVIAENVYRLIQESLNNVLKHADATRVEVTIELQDSKPGSALLVRITDDGVGTSTSSENGDSKDTLLDGNRRLGILGMRERVDLLGGSLELKSQLGQGTTIDVHVPLGGPVANSAGRD